MVKTLEATTYRRHNRDQHEHHSDTQPTCTSRFFQFLLLVFALTIAWHHMLLTSRQLQDRAKSNTNHGVGVSLEVISNQVDRTTRLTDQQKEELISVIKQLQSIRYGQQQQALAAKLQRVGGKRAASPYAYMFVMGGIHEDRREYKGFLYDVMVAASIFEELGSTADIILFVEFAPDSTLDALPKVELDYLKALNVQVHTLPKPTKATFASLVFEKFRALQLTQYRRVIFMDADAIPLANLDYIFHLSDPQHTSTPTILQPNMILASRGEPCNAGLFMLEPAQGAWEELQAIIQRQQDEGAKLPYPHFSWTRGWGYDFEQEGDRWLANTKYGQRWRFHAGHSDQGLLYYWVKFHVRKVSIVLQDHIENWIDQPEIANKTIDGKLKPVHQNTLTHEPLLQYSSPQGPLVHQFSCDSAYMQSKLKKHKPHQCLTPWRDFAHFMGDSKPWMAFSPLRRMHQQGTYLYNAATALWFQKLNALNERLQMELDFENWYEKHHAKEAPLGSMAMFSDIKKDDN